MPTVTLHILQASDDGSVNNGNSTIDLTGNNVFVGQSAGLRDGILRFTDDTESLPQSASITSAVIQVNGAGVISGDVDIEIIAEDSSNPTTFTTYANYTSRPRTSESVPWNMTTAEDESPDISNVVQEVVDRGDWAAGGGIAIFLVGQSSSVGRFQFWTYEVAGTTQAELVITYNTTPSITSVSTSYPPGRTRIGPESGDATIKFTATDSEQTGTDELNWAIWTGSGGTGTQVASGTATSGVEESVSIAYNASGLSQGSNTLYIVVDDGTASDEASTTILVDSSSPTVGTISQSPSTTTDHDYALSFVPSDTYSTDSGELSWQIRTASGGGGTLLDSGTATSGVEVQTGTITDAGLMHGSNTRWINITDGAGNVLDQSFTVTASFAAHFSSTITATATVDATFHTPVHFGATLAATSSVVASFRTPVHFTTSLAATAIVDALIHTPVHFSSDITGVSTVDATLTIFHGSIYHWPPLRVEVMTGPTTTERITGATQTTVDGGPTKVEIITGATRVELTEE